VEVRSECFDSVGDYERGENREVIVFACCIVLGLPSRLCGGFSAGVFYALV